MPICELVGLDKTATSIRSATCLDSTITVRAGCASPEPAAIVRNSNFLPETGRQTGVTKAGESGKLGVHRKAPFGAVQPEVTRLAAASHCI